ncbi:hypothetical protein FUA23_07120 [Neolewinella aurantiaca]|uniref:Uncharacterized protein n=1 Tax=Neolewinella aurantiaca TaxID=2602767 RepID=A0A5C7FK44_9BACT|nr:hypothetical protein [Neolewinella aurantiaca]TXF90283.1 hypothetical protein FUA23_07120 [Neolewinella aurantiaca]
MSNKANINETLTGPDIARLSADIPPAKGERLLTVGFTIRNCAQLIGDTLDDRGVLGWFVHMPSPAENSSQKLRFSRLVIRQQNGVPRLGIDPMTGPKGESLAEFKVFAQNPEPNFPIGNTVAENAASTYAQSMGYTAGQLHASPSAQVKDLSHYTNWSGANFFRRSDLKFMQLLLLAQADKYNDMFFTGSKVRYDVMHNPRLRVEQFSRLDPNGEIIPDPGRAFTMKAEPIMNPDQAVPSGNAMIDLLGATTDTDYSQRGTTSGNERFPGAVMATPCPPFWDIIEEIGTNLNINSTDGAEMVMEFLAKVDDVVSDPEATSVNLSLAAIVDAERRHWSYGILTFLIDLLTQWRDGGRK